MCNCRNVLPSAVALGVAISAWYLPVRFESPLLALVLAIIALFVWTTIVALCPVLHELPSNYWLTEQGLLGQARFPR